MGGAGPGAEQMVTVAGPEEAGAGAGAGAPAMALEPGGKGEVGGEVGEVRGRGSGERVHRSSSSPAGFRHFKRSSPKCPGLSSLTLSDAGCSTGRDSSGLSSFVGSERATVHTVHTVHSPKAPWRPVLSKVNRQIQLLSSEAWPWAPAFRLCQACPAW